MKIFQNSDLIEKTFVFIFLFLFLVFFVFYTFSNQREETERFNHERVKFSKKLATDIESLLEKHVDISPILTNVLSEDSVAYALVQQKDGQTIACSDRHGLPIGIFEKAEKKALEAKFLVTTEFKDPSDRLSLIEIDIPIFTIQKEKYVLRVGFFKEAEENRISHIIFRNILVFSLIAIVIASIWTVRYLAYSSIRYALIGAVTIVMLILFFISSYIIRSFYGPVWRDNFIKNDCVKLTNMLVPSAVKLIEENNGTVFEDSVKLIQKLGDFEAVSVIKDDLYVYNVDSSKIGMIVNDEFYKKSLNTNVPAVFKHSDSENYSIMIPVLSGDNRIGTISSVWLNDGELRAVAVLRDRFTMAFVFAYLILFWFMHLFAGEISKRIAWLSGEARKQLTSKNDADFIGETSLIADDDNAQQLVASVFVYFSGLSEAIQNKENDITKFIQECMREIKLLLANTKNKITVKLLAEGISITMTGDDEQDVAFEAMDFSKNLLAYFKSCDNCPFSNKITVNINKLLAVKDDEFSKEYNYIGNSLSDYKTIAKVQSQDEIIIDEYANKYLSDVAKLEKLEVISPECGKFNAYVWNDYKDTKVLSEEFTELTDWTKLMILRILENDKDFDGKNIDIWINDKSSVVKERLLKLIESKK